MMRLLSIAIAVLWLGQASALAQPSPQAASAAQELFAKATTAYNLGRFDEAVTLFSQAYEAWSHPDFLYNIAQSHRLAKNCKQALHFYRRFLSIKDQDTEAPLTPKKRQEIDRFISDLAECVAKTDSSASVQPDTLVKPQPASAAITSAPRDQRSEPAAAPSSAHRRAGLWVGAAGVAVLSVGLGFGARASSHYRDAKRACGADLRCDPASYDQGNRSISDARSSATISSVLVAAGGAAIAAGAIVFLTARSPRDRTAARLVPLPHPAGAGLAVVGGF